VRAARFHSASSTGRRPGFDVSDVRARVRGGGHLRRRARTGVGTSLILWKRQPPRGGRFLSFAAGGQDY
jgi:hypothetical protein